MIREWLIKILQGITIPIIIFGFFGVFIVLVNIGVKLYDDNSPNVAHGSNNILITVLLFLGFCYWQYREIKKWFEFEANNGSTMITVVIMWISLIPALYLLITGIVGFYAPEGIKNIIGDGPRTWATSPDSNFFIVLISSLFDAGILGGVAFAGLTFFLRFGIFTSGLSLCVALHNYFNGLDFDLASLINLIFETTISEIWGIFITIGQFLITFFIGRNLGAISS